MGVVIIEQEFSTPVTADGIIRPAERTRSCMELYGVQPQRHYLARGGLHCVCVFDAPDAEAIRSAFRTAEAAAPKAIWAATIHPGADDDVTQAPVLCNPAHTFAIVERTFAGPVSYAEVKVAEEVGTHSSNQREVRFLRSYFSSSRKRMICVYEAPDVEAVRAVNHHAGLPFERAWGAEVVVD